MLPDAQLQPPLSEGYARRTGPSPLPRHVAPTSRFFRTVVITAAYAVVLWLVVVPLVHVFYQALAHGPQAYWNNLANDADTWHAIRLTLKVAVLAVAANTVFGIAAAWAIARFRFPGRTLLTTVIDLPFAVSPVVAGLGFALVFGRQGYFGEWLAAHDIRILFATPAIFLATAFVTVPFVARELVPLLEAQGAEEDLAAISLGASGWQMFWRVTLPNIKWGLLYGIILCNARAMGEFGAVHVVSGRITGQTDTMSLRVEKLFQEYNLPGAFAVASALASVALLTLVVKTLLEWQARRESSSSPADLVPDVAPSTAPVAAPGTDGVATEAAFQAWRGSVSDWFGGKREERPRGVSVRDVTKRFGDFVALDRVSLEARHGELLALLGPSGSGKTTLLRVIAGLEFPDEGAVFYGDEDTTHRSARDRNVGFVFQHYALFRHMTVFENVAFGLRVRRWPEARIRARVRELLELVRLERFAQQYPPTLSGGQRQRVALARALAAEPRVLLLDEPFAAVDAKVRKELRQWLRKLHDQIHVTSIFVTHDQEEAFEVADRIVVMNRGRIEQEGTPEEIFEHPANAFVMDFLGNVNVFHGRAEAGRLLLSQFAGGSALPEHDAHKPVSAYVRPHELEIARLPRGASSLKAEVLRMNVAGPVVKVELFAKDFGIPLLVEIPHERREELKLQVGDEVFVFPRRVRVFVHDYQI